MKNEKILNQLKTIPNLPGSYQYFDKMGEVIYVGKAKDLKKRVFSYFNNSNTSPKIKVMVPKIERIEFIITNSEVEALILESHLIKKYKPKYNVLLKDDKKFPYFVITKEEYPRIIVARKGNKNPIKGKYFGPYTDSRAMYATLDLIKKLFPLKQCKTPKFQNRPCMYYDIKRCMAPCQKLISTEDYSKILSEVELFLSGKKEELIEKLKLEMDNCSKQLMFEKAAKYRDSIKDIKKSMEQQRVIFENTKKNRDIIALVCQGGICAISILEIRSGRLISKKDFNYDFSNIDSTLEIMESFLREYYELNSNLQFPDEIILSENISKENIELYNKWLSSKAKKPVKIIKGNSQQYIDLKSLAIKNAHFYLEKLKLDSITKIQSNYNEIGSYIKEKLHLKNFPFLVECFDISHIQGTNTVASLVVFENGLPKKSGYRKFKIKTVENKPDDFKSMMEVLKRRYNRVIKNNEKLPDLIIIDGGKGQLSSGMKIFNELGLNNIDIVSIAKREEEVFLPNNPIPIIFPSNSPALYFFQRIRDEAHRFAITFHRSLRNKNANHSILDEIKGLSKNNKEILIKNFKTIDAIKNASHNELCAFIPKRAANVVYNYFQK